jgi:hypothetical protein
MRLRALLGELQPLQQPRLVREGLFESYLERALGLHHIGEPLLERHLMREATRCTQVHSDAIRGHQGALLKLLELPQSADDPFLIRGHQGS